jgi:anti-sigma B factor antagonist
MSTFGIAQVNGIKIVSLHGRLVHDKLGLKFKDEIFEIIKECPRVVIQMRDLEYIDSLGVGTLMGALVAARGAGGDLKLAAVQRRVRQILQISHVDEKLPIYNDEQSALAAPFPEPGAKV